MALGANPLDQPSTFDFGAVDPQPQMQMAQQEANLLETNDQPQTFDFGDAEPVSQPAKAEQPLEFDFDAPQSSARTQNLIDVVSKPQSDFDFMDSAAAA